MGREIHCDSILALEKQIEEHERAIIRLKRARNSLLNVSTLLPPEILGSIFRWNVIPDGDFGGLTMGSYNFLLVCHHWFEVASCTPELWCSWGNSIRDWTRRHTRCGTAPLDLALDDYTNHAGLDDGLHDALQDRATRDNIRQVHLRGFNSTRLLESIISSIVTKGEEPRSSGVESFVVRNGSDISILDVSAFFSQYYFPKLRRLILDGCKISLRDLLKSQTVVLATLDLTGSELSPTPSLPQLLSILSSNPLLQDLILSRSSIPHTVDDDRSSPRVPLCHLKQLYLPGDLHRVFGLLNQLELPNRMDSLKLILDKCSPADISKILGPYFGDLVRRRGRFPGGGLGLDFRLNSQSLGLCVGDMHKGDDPADAAYFAGVSADVDMALEGEEVARLGFDAITHIPREQIIGLRTTLPILRSQELCAEMCDLVYLRLDDVDLSQLFVEVREPYTSKDLLHSLDHIAITWSTLGGGDWAPFIDFLSRRAAAGNQISSLRVSNHLYMGKGVVESIERVVGVFKDEDEDEESEEDPEDEESDRVFGDYWDSDNYFPDGDTDDFFADGDSDEVFEDRDGDDASEGGDGDEVFEGGDSDEDGDSDY